MDLRKKVFVVIIFTTLISALVIRSPLSVMPFLFIMIALLLSVIYLLLIKKSCEVIIDTSNIKNFKRGTSENYTIKVINKSILIFPKVSLTAVLENIDGEIFDRYEFDFILNSKQTNKLDIDLKFPHIGEYIFKIKDIEIYGIFDIGYMSYKPSWQEKIKVVPKEYDINYFNIESKNADIQVDYTVATKIDGEIYDDIREYEPGDPIKNIHWNLSAHTNDYMTRILKVDAVSGISIYLDLKNTHDKDILEASAVNDGIIESAFALSNYILEEDRVINIKYCQNEEYISRVIKESLDLKEEIYSIKNYSKKNMLPLEMIFDMDNSNDDNIFIFSPNITDELLAFIIEKNESSKNIKIFYIENINSKLSKEKLEEIGVEYYSISSPEEFILSLGGKERDE